VEHERKNEKLKIFSVTQLSFCHLAIKMKKGEMWSFAFFFTKEKNKERELSAKESEVITTSGDLRSTV
jgi:hypothetical protein